jgi:hypothetical protein
MSECSSFWYLYISQHVHKITVKKRQNSDLPFSTMWILNAKLSALSLDTIVYLVVNDAWSTMFWEMFCFLSENLWENMHRCVSEYKLL